MPDTVIIINVNASGYQLVRLHNKITKSNTYGFYHACFIWEQFMPAGRAFIPRQSEKMPQSELLNGLCVDLQPPPYSEVHERVDYTTTSVTVELNNSVRVKGKSLSFDTSSEIISVMEYRAAVPTVIDVSAFKFMRLEKPY
jgi:hypothetical protein